MKKNINSGGYQKTKKGKIYFRDVPGVQASMVAKAIQTEQEKNKDHFKEYGIKIKDAAQLYLEGKSDEEVRKIIEKKYDGPFNEKHKKGVMSYLKDLKKQERIKNSKDLSEYLNRNENDDQR